MDAREPVFDRARATGLRIEDWQNAITVNMLGQRFYDETGPAFTTNNYNSINPYTQGSYLNAKNVKYNPHNWLNAAMAGIGDGHNGGGPIWAIFDADAVAREHWHPAPPNVDMEHGFFFTAPALAELASKIVMQYQRVPMPPQTRCNAPWSAIIHSWIPVWTKISASRSRCTGSARRRSMPRGRHR